MTFIEKFEENVRQYPDKVILQDAETQLTFCELDDLSGRVYAYLKQKGIGKEDFVMICLPRGVRCCVALVGAIKAGIPCVPIAIDTPKERKDYIAKDCNIKMEIDADEWTTILDTTTLSGHETRDEHDAAYAVYTSGSEGTPKGVLLEYGIWDQIIGGFHRGECSVFQFGDVAALPFPLQGTLYAVGLLNALYAGTTFDIIPSALLANKQSLESYLTEHRVTITCLPSTLLEMLKLSTPYLRLVILSTEVAQAVSHHDFELVNLYGQTEGPTVCMHFFNGPLAKIPIGLPTDANVHPIIIDDNNRVVEKGELGELCYENHYFRTYINNPEHTANVLREGIFHTGDIARVNEDGNYVILGRKTDMIKINGNRIEPAEIEAAVKRVLDIDWAFAKGFVTEERSFICVYYTANIDVDLSAVREELMKILPTYMIPSYFIHIDDVPRLPNGKIDRQAFKAPNVEQFHNEYVAPTNEVEERLCQLMQQILEVERIGIDDDFFLLGGDSLRTIRLATECNIDGLTVNDIYAARTPRAIAERWMLKQME